MMRHPSPVPAALACLLLVACGGSGSDESIGTPPDTIQFPPANGVAVTPVYHEDGSLEVMVGETPLGAEHVIGVVSGGGRRPDVGAIMQNGNIRVRQIGSHWNRQTGDVSLFEHVVYVSWATVAREIDGNAGFDRRYVSAGCAYLIARDEARTADTPTAGTATYHGQFTGFVQTHGGGRVGHGTGDVEMTADFATAAMTVDMLSTNGNRVVLGGTIDGNGFSGTTLAQMTPNPLLQVDGAAARFEGGLYGDEAVEAGGVFEIVGGRAESPGRIVGALGGRKAE